MVENPLQLLEKQVGKTIVVWLKSGRHYKGRLCVSDAYMNLWLSDTTEQPPIREQPTIRLGQALLRGNNILFMQVNVPA